MLAINKLKTFFKIPGQLFRYRSQFIRKLYYYFSKWTHIRTNYSRNINKNFDKNTICNSELIDKFNGFKKLNLMELISKSADPKIILDKFEKELLSIDLSKLDSSDDGIITLFSSEKHDCDSPEFKFVTNNHLVEVISRYLGCVPLLTHISIWYSPNNKTDLTSSQVYHLDHEDHKQIKGFLFLRDVDLDTGPLTIINSEQSEKIQKKINYRMTAKKKRIDDETIKNLKNQQINIKEIPVMGNKGDLILVDTSKCFHFGSRSAKKPRFILAFQYITPFACVVNWKWKNYDKLYHHHCKKFQSLLIKKITGKIT